MLSDKAKITGMILQAYGICHRQVWFLTHSIFADQENELLSLGRIIDENSYAREKHQIKFGGNKFDFMQNKDCVLIVSEINKSSRAEKASILQLAHYLYELEKEGIASAGVLLYPTEKKRTDVILTEELKSTLDKSYAVIEKLSLSEKPPKLSPCKYCKKCAYGDYCWS